MSLPDRDPEAARPSPEALLDAAACQDGRGRLKIFLGAAPGVGKTYEMLTAARARRAEGIDVVIGVVETHGRAETAALLDSLETIPRRTIAYRGHEIEEMDLDAILERRPRLVLVDELAHANAPGSRHPKRYLDVEELLAAGIDVYTTLNIQHVESLNDVVARITRVRVRETVPDSVLDRADDIEVVDLSPDDLIRRLREGKVYVPEHAARALENYFSPGNLTALRELALRRTAERVDDQLLTHMQAHAIHGPWAAGERVLVCIDDSPAGAGLVRYAKRLADRFHAPWTGLYVETARSHGLTEEERDRVAACLRLVEHLGGEAVTLPGGRIAEDVLDYARANNITQIVIGKSDRPRWFEMLHGSVVHDLVRRAGAISVHVVAGEAAAEAAPVARPARGATARRAFDIRPFAASLAATAAALGIGWAAQPLVGVETVDLIFLTAVLGIATGFGLGPALLAGVASSLAYNFFFLPPLYTFTIADPTNVAAFLVFLLVAIVVSNLAARVRTQMLVARSRARTTEALYGFSRKLAGVVKLDDLLWAAAYQMAAMLKLHVVLLLAEGGRLELKNAYPPEDALDEADLGAAEWAFVNNRPAGHGADTLPGARWLFLPLRTGRGAVGVVGITRAAGDAPLAPDERRLLDALMDQAAVSIERVRLTDEMDATRMAAETERLRSALLASLSHDLKTPLASILGAVTALRQYDALYDARARDELAGTIQEEAERLGRFVANLLDMARLESGAIALDRSPVDLAEIIGTALERTEPVFDGHPTTVDLAPDLPMLTADPVLLEQVLVNLLDNAARHSPAGTPVTVQAAVEDGGLVVRVLDRGPGIPPEALERIFEKFYRVRERDRPRAGTGLGLAICRGFVEALGGTIAAADRTDGAGAVFTVRFPAALLASQPTADAAA
ncbi:MAG TPA: sensor histidine kinase KdpD [Hyphomicrobiales bacterium]|nr:sensor histidine kinase KdpD [Hyphomicrobiales bacterium]